jgi:serine/threonine-protein kinase HipA
LALTLDRGKRKLKLADFVGLAEGMGLNARQIRYGFSVFIKNKKKAFEWLDRSFLSGELI